MKIAWLQDNNPFGTSAGAESTDRAHIIHGLREGHDVEVVLPGVGDVSWADLVIISNASNFPLQALCNLGRPYVLFFHDYWALCRWRLYYPMQQKCLDCYLKPRYLPLLLGSEKIIWLSPLHRGAWLFTYPELENHPYSLVPSSIDVNQFFDMGLARSGFIAVNSGQKCKGYERVGEWAEENRDQSLTLVGASEGPMPPNVVAAGNIGGREMNKLYNQHETFLHLPQNPMPFDRTVAEAYLAGCKILGNELVGALSWPFMREEPSREVAREFLGKASSMFWAAIDDLSI